MNIEKMKEFIALRKELKATGVVGLNIHEDSVHVRPEVLVGEESLEIQCDYQLNYPYRLSTVKDGVEIFSIMTSDELEELFPQFKGYLVEDVDLSGMKEVI